MAISHGFNKTEAATSVTQAHVVRTFGHEMKDARGCLDILAGHERSIGGHLNKGVEVPRPYRDLLDFHELGHRAAPLLLRPRVRTGGLV